MEREKDISVIRKCIKIEGFCFYFFYVINIFEFVICIFYFSKVIVR